MPKMTQEKRKKMEKIVYDYFNAFDKTGTNTEKWKKIFSSMSDNQFDNYFKGLFANEKAYIIPDIVDYEHTIKFEDIQKAAKVLGIPLFEYVHLPHLSMDKSKVVITREPVAVGYLTIKRTQQTVSKKKGISTSNSRRSGLTGQVTADDKNGRESDLENFMLTSMGLTNVMKELNGPRADDMVMKSDMMKSIAINGYTNLSDLESDVENKTTLNTVDVFFMGMSLKTDLVNKGLMTKKTLKDEL